MKAARISHRTRRAILVRLMAHGGPQTSGKIAGRMEHSWQTTSRHLRLLEEAGLISVALQGRERVYTLNADQLIWLKQNGVSERVVWAMQASGRPPVRYASPPGVYYAPRPVYVAPPPVVGVGIQFRGR